MSKSLLRELEDENAELSRANLALQQELGLVRKTVAQQEKALVASAALASREQEAAAAAREASRAAASRAAALEQEARELRGELRVARRESDGRARECARLDAAVQQAREECASAREAAEALRAALQMREAAVQYEAARGAALEGGVDALAVRLRAAERSGEARVADWLAERRRLQEELRRASDAGAALHKAYGAQLARVARLRERLDMIAHSLRACPPRRRGHGEVSAPRPAARRRHSLSAKERRAQEQVEEGKGQEGGAPAGAAAAASDGQGVDQDRWVPVELYEQLEREVKKLRSQQAGKCATARKPPAPGPESLLAFSMRSRSFSHLRSQAPRPIAKGPAAASPSAASPSDSAAGGKSTTAPSVHGTSESGDDSATLVESEPGSADASTHAHATAHACGRQRTLDEELEDAQLDVESPPMGNHELPALVARQDYLCHGVDEVG
ncbi:hypothetical protein AB1Y20_021470 [Prymnesium parvum]|uniref:Cilia- and flagella-associated protein 157 n=1 Tax=Prymnesium parvum TaxID=97485 RepID=A0AB34JIT2_PRYPA